METTIGDECWGEPQVRPDDCFYRPPCAYYDATLRVAPTSEGAFIVRAADPRTFGDERREGGVFSVASARDAVSILPELLRSIDVRSRPSGDYCVVVFADRSMRFADVLAVLHGLENRRVRHVTLYAQLDE